MLDYRADYLAGLSGKTIRPYYLAGAGEFVPKFGDKTGHHQILYSICIGKYTFDIQRP
jgi:hypothetical protein